MSLEIGRFTSLTPVAPTPRPAAPAAVPAAAVAPPRDANEIPLVPPPHVRDEVDRAADRIDELHAQGRELHFSKDEHSGRVIIEVRDLEGKVIRTIPPSHALAVMSGAEL